jgi:Uncharacterized conserved protein (DUF2285)
VWLPHLTPAVVLLAPAPAEFREAHSIDTLPPIFLRAAGDGEYRVVGSPQDRTPYSLAVPRLRCPSPRSSPSINISLPALTLPFASGKPWLSNLSACRIGRLMLALRALDGHLAGESYRTIAQGLFGERRVPSGASWKTHDLRDRTIRLVHTGLHLMRGGYLELLTHQRTRRR